MSDPDFAQFIADRDEALRSLDINKLRAYAAKYGSSLSMNDEIAEIAMHKARTACLNLTEDERALSRDWLVKRGYSHFGDKP